MHILMYYCCRQGSVIPFTQIRGPDAWTAKEYKNSEKYIYRLAPSDIAELDRAVAAAKALGKPIQVSPDAACLHMGL